MTAKTTSAGRTRRGTTTRGGKPYEPKQSRAEIAKENAERQAKALKLRTMRFSYDEIAKQCGYASRGAAYNAVKSALAAIPMENAKELRASELAHLDAVESRLGQRLLRGELRAIDRMLRIKDMRAKLTGLYDEHEDSGVEEVRDVLRAFMAQAVAEDEAEGDDDGAENAEAGSPDE